MAASDATYRNIKTLHILFAVSSIVMLLTIVAMFADDYFRDWKVEQRLFYDVEEEMAKRAVLAAAPPLERVEEIKELEKQLKEKKQALEAARVEMESKLGDLPTRKLKTENEYASVKADYDSVMTFYNRATEVHGGDSKEAQEYQKQLDELAVRMDTLKAAVEENQKEYDKASAAAGLPKMAEEVAEVERKHKELLAEFDRFLKLAAQKRWGVTETIRSLPILDGFASPTRINQYTLTELPIDYSFKHVTRYDRCTTCHLGMEKAAYDPVTLASLTDDPGRNKELWSRYKGASEILKQRIAAGATDLPDPDTIQPRWIDSDRLTPGRIEQFAVHPRLDLFVDAASPHSAEKFGCTICHSGQGSATAFYEASHSPNNNIEKERWREKYHWKSNHYWDFPMVSNRFIESSCLKCHHEVTDLVRHGNKDEAPKLTRGYNLVRELGCFGCHEIAGTKGGKRIGPDLRLENEIPLENMDPAERAKLLSDPANPPGTMRKVGPNLGRLSEKTNEEWVRQWLKSPRGFRENTKMPHFYLQPNNIPEVLPEDQKKYPDNEIHAIAHYLINKSQNFVGALKKFHEEKLDARTADAEQVEKLNTQLQDLEKQLTAKDVKEPEKIKADIERVKKELEQVKSRIKNRDELRALAAPAASQPLPETSDANRGRMLFQERGCMACHSHDETLKPGAAVDGKTIPPMEGEATFGPDLTRLAHKIAPEGGKPEDGRRWLVAWLLNPMAHNPRTLMPDTQLTLEQANDIAAWLLSQKVEWKVSEREKVDPADTKTLKDMAALYLRKTLSISEVKEVLETKSGFTVARLREIAASNPEADELELGGDLTGKNDDEIVPIDDHKLKMYVGKMAIGNLGCYACHSIPGFEKAKPIGTALNEWGKKDVERLAFEDAHNFIHDHFNIVPTRGDPKDPKKVADQFRIKDGKKPYEAFFADMLDHHGRSREGFLHLKLEEPRAYDYNRIRPWEDRLRMPQFKFARPKRLPGETNEQYTARTIAQEAEDREAVMTFILGLVAEQIPSRYVHTPSADKLNEIKGRQVLEKYNCAGCHIVRPGSTEFKLAGGLPRIEDLSASVLYKHETKYGGDDYYYPDHVSWAGRQTPTDATGRLASVRPPIEVKFDDDEEPSKDVAVWLMQAFRYRQGNTKNGPVRDVLAGSTVFLPPDSVTRQTPQYGGVFMEQLVQYLQRKDRENFGGQAKLSNAYAAAPPSLVGEGEKAQPDWLYRFLRNPYAIRPLTVLRMPKFNMSPDEAQALVNYFAAVDKTENPGIGLTYPYVRVPQREDGYLEKKTQEYIARLKATNQYEARKKEFQSHWEAQLAAEKAAADMKLAEAEEKLKMAPEAAKAEATRVRDEAKKAADAAREKVEKKDVAEFVKRWETREAYVADAARLVTHGNLCLTCHRAGGVEGKENKGPNLDHVADRLRPDWTMRWVTNPNRFLHYVSVMPINFKSTAVENQDAFVGSSAEQIQAARDFLMLYPEIRDWSVLRARPLLGTGSATPAPAGGQ